MPPIDKRLFTDAMRLAATAVSVITTDGEAGRVGATVSSFCTATADPPQMLACLYSAGTTPAALRRNGVFCINLLERGQRHVADSFAGRIAQWKDDRFACDKWTHLSTGAPVLEGALISLDCRLTHELALSTHTVFVGEVVALATAGGMPLLYADQSYQRLAEPGVVNLEDFQL
ncbi:MAG: flavin reductase [Betaproteobacteria bacterium]|nr:flavin reductase [Betaproteobacteria bacterium]